MKRLVSVLIALVSLIGVALAFTGCGEKKFNNDLPHKEALVSIDYSDTVTKKTRLSITNGNEKFNFSGIEFFNKDSSKKVKKLIGGDRLEVYYSDESYKKIDHILVKKAKISVLEIEIKIPPGSANITQYVHSNDPDTSVNISVNGAYWAIDKNENYTYLEQIEMGTKLYGTYIEEEVVETIVNTKVHYIHALYTYDPR